MTRRRIFAMALATLVLLALGASQTFAGKGGNGGGKPGGGDPPADPAIAYRVGTTMLRVVNEDGSNGTTILTDSSLGGSIGAPHWSPDGEKLVFSSTGHADGISRIYVINKDGTGLTELREANTASALNGGLAWSPVPLGDGRHKIAYGDSVELSDGTLSYSVHLMNTDGSDPVRLERATGHLSWSPTASRLAVSRGDKGIRVHTIEVSAAGDVAVTQSPRYDIGATVVWLAWAKNDSDRLAVGTISAGGPEEIYIVDLSHAVPTSEADVFLITDGLNLTDSPATSDLHPDWSPDDSQIVYYRRPSPPKSGPNKQGLYLLAVDGSGEPQELGVGGDARNPTWRR